MWLQLRVVKVIGDDGDPVVGVEAACIQVRAGCEKGGAVLIGAAAGGACPGPEHEALHTRQHTCVQEVEYFVTNLRNPEAPAELAAAAPAG